MYSVKVPPSADNREILNAVDGGKKEVPVGKKDAEGAVPHEKVPEVEELDADASDAEPELKPEEAKPAEGAKKADAKGDHLPAEEVKPPASAKKVAKPEEEMEVDEYVDTIYKYKVEKRSVRYEVLLKKHDADKGKKEWMTRFQFKQPVMVAEFYESKKPVGLLECEFSDLLDLTYQECNKLVCARK